MDLETCEVKSSIIIIGGGGGKARVPCHLARRRRFWADCGGGRGGKWKVLTSSRPPPPPASLGRRRTTALPACLPGLGGRRSELGTKCTGRPCGKPPGGMQDSDPQTEKRSPRTREPPSIADRPIDPGRESDAKRRQKERTRLQIPERGH